MSQAVTVVAAIQFLLVLVMLFHAIMSNSSLAFVMSSVVLMMTIAIILFALVRGAVEG